MNQAILDSIVYDALGNRKERCVEIHSNIITSSERVTCFTQLHKTNTRKHHLHLKEKGIPISQLLSSKLPKHICCG